MTQAKFSEAQHFSFALLHLRELEKFEHYIKDKTLNYRDITVLFSMMIRCDPRTAKIKFMVKTLAEDIGMNATSVSASIAKLKKLMLVAMFIERNGEKYYLINPYIFSVGKKQKWGFYVQKFLSAFSDEAPTVAEVVPTLQLISRENSYYDEENYDALY